MEEKKQGGRVESGVGGERLSWNTGAELKQVGEHDSNKAHPSSVQQVHLSVSQNPFVFS